MDAKKRAKAPESGAFNAALGHRTRPNFVRDGIYSLQSSILVYFRVQLVRRILSLSYFIYLETPALELVRKLTRAENRESVQSLWTQ